jgi:hypothetical protein
MTTTKGTKMTSRRNAILLAVLCVLCGPSPGDLHGQARAGLTPGSRVLLDAHNAYPEQGRWADRIDRALGTGLPVAIEQDLAWYRDPVTGVGRSIVSHGEPYTGQEPSLRDYFFERIRPLVEQALRENRAADWPIITLNLDLKTDEAEHHAAIWQLLGEYEPWLTTAPRGSTDVDVRPLTLRPVLVLTGEADSQQRDFHDRLPVGTRLRLFGAVHRASTGGPMPQTNYRRWWNNPWAVVEPEGQPRSAEWTTEEQQCLQRAVGAAHGAGLWIRVYTLDGFTAGDTSNGWTASYNFGSLEAARIRWRAAIAAGVDFVAVDQYEEFARTLHDTVLIEGVLTRDDYERVLERAFIVPAGTERIDIDLTYQDAERTVIDLGLRGPAGFRGWSGGGPQQAWVAAHSAAYGYSPGAPEAGQWTLLLGVPNIRPGISARYTVRIRFNAPEARPVLSTGARWYVGDLHAHSGHSDGRTLGANGTRIKVPATHVFAAAQAAKLDFIALTDHNTTSHWADVDRQQAMHPAMLLLHAREVTTYRGHMNAFGERRFVPFAVAPGHGTRDILRELSGAGAFVSINHPALPDGEACMGCGWNDDDPETMRAAGAVEIVNGDTVEGDLAGWPFWARQLNRGHRLVAIGGSDEHTPDESVDRRIGTPATVVYATALSEEAIVDGLRSGRVYVRARGVDGPAIEFGAEADQRRYQMGATLPASARVLRLSARVSSAAGQRIEWVRNGEVFASESLTASGELSVTPPSHAPGDWFSLIVRDATGPTVFSNAIYISR